MVLCQYFFSELCTTPIWSVTLTIFLAAALTTSHKINILYFDFFVLSSDVLKHIPHFPKDVRKGVNLVEECFALIFLFVREVILSVHIALLFSETNFSRRSVIVILNFSAKTAPVDEKRLSLLIIFYWRNQSEFVLQTLFPHLSHSSLVFLFVDLRMVLKALFVCLFSTLKWNWPNNFTTKITYD